MRKLHQARVFYFLAGLLIGLFAGVAIVSYFAAGSARKTADLTVRSAGIQKQTTAEWKQTANALQSRAEACEAKFRVGTIIYERRPAASIPLAGGLLSLQVAAGELKPAWYIPAEVRVYSNQPDAHYVWQEMRTGKILGTYQVLPPETMAQPK